MEIRIAAAQDFPELASLRWDFKIEDGEVPASSQKEFEERLLSQMELEHRVWVHFLAQDLQEVVGMVSICLVPKLLTPNLKGDSIGYLTNTYVTPTFRNQGIGEKLLSFAADWAKKESLELLFVWPSDRSRSFYTRLGFRSENEVMELLFV